MVAAVLAPADAAPQRRLALIIGNSGYQNVAELTNPVNDANDIAEKIRHLLFGVMLGTDLTRDQMHEAFETFSEQLRPGDVGSPLSRSVRASAVSVAFHELAEDRAVGFEPPQRLFFVLGDQPAVAGDVCRDNDRNFPFHARPHVSSSESGRVFHRVRTRSKRGSSPEVSRNLGPAPVSLSKEERPRRLPW